MCPNLESLELRVFSASEEELQVLVATLEAGALPSLTSLTITCCTPLVRFFSRTRGALILVGLLYASSPFPRDDQRAWR